MWPGGIIGGLLGRKLTVGIIRGGLDFANRSVEGWKVECIWAEIGLQLGLALAQIRSPAVADLSRHLVGDRNISMTSKNLGLGGLGFWLREVKKRRERWYNRGEVFAVFNDAAGFEGGGVR